MKQYGIRVTLPKTDPMRNERLLGPDWESFRWFDSTAERDDAFEDMSCHLPNYRQGDNLSQVLEKVERAAD